GKDYFYYPDAKTLGEIIELHDLQHKFDNLFHSFTEFGQNQILQSYLIDEIAATNAVEGIKSTRHDIFYVIGTGLKAKDAHVHSIVRSYLFLLNQKMNEINSLKDIREIYDSLLSGSIDDGDKPDGRYFRKDSVSVSDGIQDIHHGISGEKTIEGAMKEFLVLINNDRIEIYQKLFLSHFLLETIHPYYDGNGRLGRYLMSSLLYEKTESTFAFLLSSSINKRKSQYYAAFKEAREFHNFGNINSYMDKMIKITKKGLEEEIKNLEAKKKECDSLLPLPPKAKSEDIVYRLLSESTRLSYFGLSNEEISRYSSLSKREVIYCLNSLREKGVLVETKIGKYTYRKLNETLM
ncbi:MAG: Fic family protein, partial [Bacilli bacterium]|nr:Fic family protein [Bacilli bacterium]